MIHSLWHRSHIVVTLLWHKVLDAFFPIRCLRCGAYDVWICNDCHHALPLVIDQHCPVCTKHVTLHGEVCPPCLLSNSMPFDGVYIASSYKEPLIQKMIHHFKYRFIKDLAQPLAFLLAQSLHHSHMPTPDIIIPVPLHPRRYRWRGFNQAEELAHALDLQIPIYTDILKRVRYTAPQVTMRDKSSRLQNMHNAFSIRDNTYIRDKDILLIDDVMTTGATITACATTLKMAGARTVHVLVIARE